MELFKRYKMIILSGVVTVVLFAVYSMYFPNNDSSTLTQEKGGAGVSVDTELLTLVLSLKSIELNDTLFSLPEFRSLVDLGKEISPEPTGRENPFRPFEFFAK